MRQPLETTRPRSRHEGQRLESSWRRDTSPPNLRSERRDGSLYPRTMSALVRQVLLEDGHQVTRLLVFDRSLISRVRVVLVGLHCLQYLLIARETCDDHLALCQ